MNVGEWELTRLLAEFKLPELKFLTVCAGEGKKFDHIVIRSYCFYLDLHIMMLVRLPAMSLRILQNSL